MTVPAPPADGSGGVMVIKYTNGTVTHRLRVHVLAFNTDATMTYTAPPAGGDASVSVTFAALAAKLAAILNNTWTLSLDAMYIVAQPSGTLSQYFGYTAPSTVAGASATASGITEGFVSFNWRTAGGHRLRFFLYSPAGWAYQAAGVYTPASAGNVYQQIAYVVTSAGTGIVGHDGSKAIGTMHTTWGTNRRLRRKVGNA